MQFLQQHKWKKQWTIALTAVLSCLLLFSLSVLNTRAEEEPAEEGAVYLSRSVGAASTAEFYTDPNVGAGDLFFYTYLNDAYTPAYCLDYGKYDPAGDTYQRGEVTNALGYVMRHGYPNDSLGTFADEARYATQIAVFIIRGFDPYVQGVNNAGIPMATMDVVARNSGWSNAVRIGQELAARAAANASAEDASYAFLWNAPSWQMQNMVTPSGKRIGWLGIKKSSADTQLTDGNVSYQLAGAQYTVYAEEACETALGVLETDATGASNLLELEVGTYYIRETKASPGYLRSSNVISADVAWEEITMAEDAEQPGFDRIKMLLRKADAESGAYAPSSDAVFSGAQFTAQFYGGYYTTKEDAEASGQLLRCWTFETENDGVIDLADPNGKVTGDALYTDPQTGEPGMPQGTLVLCESKAPQGYLENREVFVVTFQIGQDGNRTRTVYPQGSAAGQASESVLEIGVGAADCNVVFHQQIARGNFTFRKSEEGAERMGGCLFAVTQVSTGETHYLVTDPNGIFDSSVFEKNNANDKAVTIAEDGTYQVDESLLSYQNNVWFSGGCHVPANQELGSFPYGTYLFTEIRTSANVGRSLISFHGTVYNDRILWNSAKVIDLGTKDDKVIRIETNARDAADGDQLVAPEKDAVLVDEVRYEGLERGQRYTVKGTLWDKTKGDYLTDADGNRIEGVTEFTTSAGDGTTEVNFAVPAELLEQMDEVVIFEELYANGQLAATHRDDKNTAQTLKIQPHTPETPELPEAPETGDSNHIWVWIVLMAFAAIVVAGNICYIKRRSKKAKRR